MADLPDNTEESPKKKPTRQSLVRLKVAILQLLTSKTFDCLVLISFFEMLVLFLIVATHIPSSGLSIRTHWDLIGIFRTMEGNAEQPWFYVFTSLLFPVVVFGITFAISIKLYMARGRQLALCWLWLMALIGLIITVMMSTFILRTVAIS